MSGLRTAFVATAVFGSFLITATPAHAQMGKAGSNGLIDSMTGEKGQARADRSGQAQTSGSAVDVPRTRELTVSESIVSKRALEAAKAQLRKARAAVADDATWQATGKALAERWFGSSDTGTRQRILQGLDRMIAKDAHLGHGTIKKSAVAFVHPAWPSTIHVTDAFFLPEQVERRTRTMVHELSHFRDTVDTDDVKFTAILECRVGNTFSQECIGLEAYGRENAQKLLARKRMKNADNWAFFVGDLAK